MKVNLPKFLSKRLFITGRYLSKVNLNDNGIVPRGCASTSQLLGNRESNLKVLSLYGNLIDDESVTTFADALGKNTKLTELDLGGNDGITAVGLSTGPTETCL